jgi:hypothetical protein
MPRPGIEPGTLDLQFWSPTHCHATELHCMFIKCRNIFLYIYLALWIFYQKKPILKGCVISDRIRPRRGHYFF